MELENRIGELPDYYAKKTTSNNYKLLELMRQGKVILAAGLDDIRAASSVETATGYALDMWGKSYGVYRAGESDDLYRSRIQIRMMRGRIFTDYTSWRSALLMMLGCPTEDLIVTPNAKKVEIHLDVDINYYSYAEAILDDIQLIAPLTADVTLAYIENTYEQVAERTWGTVAKTTWWGVDTDRRYRLGGTI